MKVVDMFSASLPCLAYDYLCIDELVQDHTNGRLFKGVEDLTDELFDALKNFDAERKTEVLNRYRQNLQSFGSDSWDDQWRSVMLPHVIDEK